MERDNQTARLHINHLTQSAGETNTLGRPAWMQPGLQHKLAFVTQTSIALSSYVPKANITLILTKTPVLTINGMWEHFCPHNIPKCWVTCTQWVLMPILPSLFLRVSLLLVFSLSLINRMWCFVISSHVSLPLLFSFAQFLSIMLSFSFSQSYHHCSSRSSHCIVPFA